MRKILLHALIVLSVLMWSCEGIYDMQQEYEGEVVYPAKFDTIIGYIGYERVEIDLLKVGRIPSSEIKLGKAKKTKITYDDKEIIIDSLVSYVNITDLKQSKLYRFQISTLDEFGNESVPQEVALIPFTESDLSSFAIAPPRVMTSPSAAVVDWPNGISSVLMNYYGLNYQFKDKEGVSQSGKRGSNPRFFIGNLQSGKPVEVSMEYKIVPIVNREPILDTLVFKDKLVINMPTSSSVFPPIERDILLNNGVTTFTADGVSQFEELVYPVHTNSLQDIFYFPNLKRLDLTGGDLFSLPLLKYEGGGVVDYVGGGDFEPFMRKAGDVSSGNQQALKDLLESGILEKVYYRPNTMGLDNLLMPYVESGVVELIEAPSSILVDNRFHLNGRVQANSFRIDFTYPATDAPAGEGLENIYKLVLKANSASFVFALPKEYQLNAKDYKYLRMKIHAPSAASFEGSYAPYKCLWPRFMNHMWSFGGNSAFGQQYWAIPKICLEDNMLEKWVDVKLDISQAESRHTRVIILNIGAEPGISFNRDIVYYFSNIRFTKE